MINKSLKTLSVFIGATATLALSALPSLAAIPFFNATCPGKIEVHADQGGPIFINGKEAKLIVKKSNYYEAQLAKGEHSDIVISVAVNPDDTVTVSYTWKKGVNGMCTVSE